MCFRISRSTGAIIGQNFKFCPTNFRKNISTLRTASEEGFSTIYSGVEYKVKMAAVFNDDIINRIEIHVEGNEKTWNDFNTINEFHKFNILQNILDKSNIKNGEILPWGMANCYYDSRSACSYLIIYYRFGNDNIPNPIFNTNISP